MLNNACTAPRFPIFLLCSPSLLPSSRLRVNEKLEGDTAGTAELNHLRIVHILRHCAQQQKLWDRKKEVRDFSFQYICCSQTGWASLCFWKVVSDCLCSTSIVFPPLLPLLSCLSQLSGVFLGLLLLFSSLYSWRREEE